MGRIHKLLLQKSFFRRFLLSYLIVLMIPVLTICITYVFAQWSIQEEIINSNDKSLRQFAGITDSKFSKMTSTAFEVLSNATVREFSGIYSRKGTNYGYQAYEVKNYLGGLPTNDFSDLFVYYIRSDFVISAFNASLSGNMYLDVYYGRDTSGSETEARDTGVLESGEPNMPRLAVLDKGRTNPHLALLYPRNANYILGKSDVVAGAVLLPGRLQQMLDSAIYHPESILCILDASGAQLVTSSPTDLQVELSKFDEKSRIYKDGKNVLQFLRSEVVDCIYLTVTPEAVFWERLNALRLICIGCLLLCLVVSAAVAVTLSRRNYSPINSVLDMIFKKTHQTLDLKTSNEMEFINLILARSLEENDMLNSRIKSEHNTLRDDFLLRALAGTWNQEHEEDAFSDNNITLLSDRFCVMLFWVEASAMETGESTKPMNSQRELFVDMESGFQKLSGQKHQGFLLALSPMLYAGVLNFAREDSEQACMSDALETGWNMKQSLQTRFGITCTIGVSKIQSGLIGIHMAYVQSSKAMNYRYLFGKGSLIRFDDIATRNFRYDHSTESKAAQLMLNHVQGAREETAESVVGQVMASSGIGSGASMETVECFKYDLIGSLNRILHETGTMHLDSDRHLVSTLITAETMHDFEKALAGTLEQLRLYHGEHKARYTICDKAADYIRSHYRDTNLNNTVIGEELGISASYLSKLFKEQNGIGLLDYLCKIRICRAKDLLRNSQDTMDEIAQQTGFLSSGTFIKTFKKVEGITPGAYRKLIMPGTLQSNTDEVA